MRGQVDVYRHGIRKTGAGRGMSNPEKERGKRGGLEKTQLRGGPKTRVRSLTRFLVSAPGDRETAENFFLKFPLGINGGGERIEWN